MADQTQEWEFPTTHVGDFVLVSPTPQDMNKALGQVVVVDNGSVDIIVWGYGNPQLLHTCLHIDDPTIPERQDLLRMGDSGVFEFTHDHKERAEVYKRLDELETMLAGIAVSHEDVRQSVVKLKQKAKERKAKPN